MISISVCMIVKNEEAVLARCLDCLTGIADEIIVVDTGSTDSTPGIARKYTEKIFPFQWRDDFAEARNFAFSKATKDYIYSADADEVIDGENREKFRLLKQTLSPETELVEMRYANQLQFNTNYNYDVEYRPKLFRRVRGFHWVEPVHETVDLSLHMLESDIVITHCPSELHAKRDFLIFQEMVRKGPLNSRLHRMYAKELFFAGESGDFLSACPYFESTLHEESRSLDDIRVSQCVAARCARLQENSVNLFKTALKNVIGGTPCAEVCCELGEYFQSAGDCEEAATWFYTAAFGAESEIDLRASGIFPLRKLADCYEALGLPEEAQTYRAKAGNWKAPGPDSTISK
ncbi:glycosyltransferase family 2 protein [Caproiciproducens sp. NJN-50]|nr:glycosyltransferase family 2 protein [Caproiciproducens sp. NJN-50]